MDHNQFDPNLTPNSTPNQTPNSVPNPAPTEPINPSPAPESTYHTVGSEFSTERPYAGVTPPPQEPSYTAATPSYTTPDAASYNTTPAPASAYTPNAAPGWGVPPVPPKPPKRKKKGGLIAIVCIVLFLIGMAGGYWAYSYFSSLKAPAVNPGESQTQKEDTLSGTDKDFSGGTFDPVYGDDDSTYSAAEIYQNSINGVVGIATETTTQNVFGQPSTYAVTGTGFIFSADGYILTNCHIVEGATAITVTTYDEKEYKATLVGKDATNDVAVLKIDATDLTVLPIGTSADMMVGEEILIIGNPLGELTYTLTRGIVSNLSREIQTEENDIPIKMFQTDAAINAGNSGGPAIDAHGNVIGLVSAKYASSTVEGLGFCIPIDDAMTVAQSLIENGYVKGRAYLGLNNYQAVAGYAGGQYVTGVQVYSVVAGSCAEKAGITSGDVITEMDGTEINSAATLKGIISSHKAGDTVEITVYRSREFIKVTVVLDEATA